MRVGFGLVYFQFIPVCYCARSAITKGHSLIDLNNRHLFSASSGGLKSKQVKQGWFILRPLFLACRCHLFPVSSCGLVSVCVCML